MRRTKLVCTLGPATDSRDAIRALIAAGMDVARLNFSHGSHKEHARRLRILREEARAMGRTVAALQDLQGPKIRTGRLEGDTLNLEDDSSLTITTEQVTGHQERTGAIVSTDYAGLPNDVKPDDRILLSDGLIELRVVETSDVDVQTTVVHGGRLRPRQGINLPGVGISAASVTARDLADLEFGLAHDVDWVAISFVRHADDVRTVKKAIAAHGRNTPVIAKLEKPEALQHLDAILDVADGVMVARGDLGVEMQPEDVPMAQKEIIRCANRAAKPVITATQMLDSMIHNPRPTRAEVSDVANAILDGSDAVMLSGETAIGAFPIASAAMLARIAETVDDHKREAFRRGSPWELGSVDTIPQGIGAAVAAICRSMHVRAVCVLTRSGTTARLVSHYRPEVPILAFTPQVDSLRRLPLLWGVTPVHNLFAPTEKEYFSGVQRILLDSGKVDEGDIIVLTGGHPVSEAGPTNFIKIMVVARPAPPDTLRPGDEDDGGGA